MKKILLLVVLVLSVSISFSKEIKSIESGGNWFDKSTWHNSEIPSENDDVLILGTVIVNSPVICTNITISENAKLTFDTPLINPNIVNDTIKNFGTLIITENTSLDCKVIKNKTNKLFNFGIISVGMPVSKSNNQE